MGPFSSTVCKLLFVLIYGIYVTSNQANAAIMRLNKTTGIIYSGGLNLESWQFYQPRVDDDVIFVINVFYLKNYNSIDEIRLPDGSVLPKRDIDKDKEPICQVFTKKGSRCKAGTTFSAVCDTPSSASLGWPPVIERTEHLLYFQLSYSFFSCVEIQGCDEVKTTTTSSSSSQKQCDPMTETFVILGALLALSLALTFFLLYRSIIEKKKREKVQDQKPPYDSQNHQTSTTRGRSGTSASTNSTVNVTYEMSVKPAYRSSADVGHRNQIKSNYENPYQEIKGNVEGAEYNQLAR